VCLGYMCTWAMCASVAVCAAMGRVRFHACKLCICIACTFCKHGLCLCAWAVCAHVPCVYMGCVCAKYVCVCMCVCVCVCVHVSAILVQTAL
jgi:hypothetical protein